MARLLIRLPEHLRSLLERHWRRYRSLDLGLREPLTAAEEQFVRMCRGGSEPVSNHDLAYLEGRRLLQATKLSEEEVIGRGFRVSLQDMRDVAIECRATQEPHFEHAVDVDRFATTRRIVRRHNW